MQAKGEFMKNYTLAELSSAATYEADPELATWTRKICATTHTDDVPMPFGAWKREYLEGKHAEHVYQELQAKLAADEVAADAASRALFAKNAKIRKALETLTLPAGVEIAGNSDTHLHVKADWDGGSDLSQRIKRIGGQWNRSIKAFEVPIDSVPSLQRIFNNWRKAQDEREATEAEQRRQREAERVKAQAEREAQWAKERQEQQVAYAAQRKAQAKAVAERVLVKAGEYKIGDILEGKPITGFGKQWTESSLSHGQLYQPCEWGRCEGEPVCASCFLCSKHCSCGEQVTWCYAYFS